MAHTKEPNMTQDLQYATTYARRAGLARDLPEGDNENLRWVSNSATLIYGEDDAVLVIRSPRPNKTSS
jgi:hypothetical protein